MNRLARLGAIVVAVVVLAGCASFEIQPATAPHYVYLGTGAAAIAADGTALEDEQELVDDMVDLVGWWTAFRGVESLLVQATGRQLRWWERALFWILPTAINVRRIFTR